MLYMMKGIWRFRNLTPKKYSAKERRELNNLTSSLRTVIPGNIE